MDVVNIIIKNLSKEETMEETTMIFMIKLLIVY